MKTYTREELNEILELHLKWLNDEDGGIRADLNGAYLNGAYLRGADLRGAYLNGADLRGAYLSGAHLRGADLDGAYLRGAYLDGADLNGADLDGAYLRGAYLDGADLNGAYLRGADLRGAYLNGADLDGALGNLTHVKSIQCEKYYITYTSEVLQIGCQRYTIEEWKEFDDDTISNMDCGALEWWYKWKPIIMQIIEMSPAEPTGATNG